ncbi:hypothetical protein C8T65DRAFT_751188 [Cerioporus squamosus]|nr:hypothetical protein C8T65DRAFT_751188 [Cerioporus squamosus]
MPKGHSSRRRRTGDILEVPSEQWHNTSRQWRWVSSGLSNAGSGRWRREQYLNGQVQAWNAHPDLVELDEFYDGQRHSDAKGGDGGVDDGEKNSEGDELDTDQSAPAAVAPKRPRTGGLRLRSNIVRNESSAEESSEDEDEWGSQSDWEEVPLPTPSTSQPADPAKKSDSNKGKGKATAEADDPEDTEAGSSKATRKATARPVVNQTAALGLSVTRAPIAPLGGVRTLPPGRGGAPRRGGRR